MDNFDDVDHYAPDKFIQQDRQGFFLSNFGDNFSLVLVLLGIDGISYFVIKFFSKYKIIKVMEKIRTKIFNPKFYLDLYWGLYIELCFSVFLQLQAMETADYFVEVFSYFIAFIGIPFVVLPFAFAYMIKYQKYSSITEVITENLNFKYYNILLYIRKFYFILFIVSIYKNPNLQIGLLVAWHIFQFTYNFKTKPYIKRQYNCLQIIQSLFFLVGTSFLFVLNNCYLEGNQYSRIYIGWIIIINFVIVIMADFYLFLYETIITSYEIIKEICNKIKIYRKNRQRIVPMDILIDMRKVKSMSVVSTQQKNQNEENNNISQSNQKQVDVKPVYHPQHKISCFEEASSDFNKDNNFENSTNRLDNNSVLNEMKSSNLSSLRKLNTNRNLIEENDQFSIVSSQGQFNQNLKINSFIELASPDLLNREVDKFFLVKQKNLNDDDKQLINQSQGGQNIQRRKESELTSTSNCSTQMINNKLDSQNQNTQQNELFRKKLKKKTQSKTQKSKLKNNKNFQ